jgi:hypothetical protein
MRSGINLLGQYSFLEGNRLHWVRYRISLPSSLILIEGFQICVRVYKL